MLLASASAESVNNGQASGLGGASGGNLSGGGGGGFALPGGGDPAFADPFNNDPQDPDTFDLGTGVTTLTTEQEADDSGLMNAILPTFPDDDENEQSPVNDGTGANDVWNDAVSPSEVDPLQNDEMLTKEQMMELGFIETKAQPEWIRRHGIDGHMIADRYPEDPQDFVEFEENIAMVVFDSENDDSEVKLRFKGIKAGDWCFVTFRKIGVALHRRHKRTYFFPCATLLTPDKLWLREMKEECMMPKVVEPNPPTIEKCKWFYKKIEACYEFTVREMGPVDGSDMMECYVQSVKKMTQQPRVEILCSKGAVEDEEFTILTRADLEHIKNNFTDNGDNTFTGDQEENVVTTVDAKVTRGPR